MPVVIIYRIIENILRLILKPTRSRLVFAALIVLTLAFISATAFYFAEKDSWALRGEELTFLRALYWSIITMATVGYGDIVPTTDAGMVVAGFTAVFGIAAYSLLVAIVAEQFLSHMVKKTLGLAWLKNIDIVVIGDGEECAETIAELKRNMSGKRIAWVTSEQPKITIDVDYAVGSLVDSETLKRGGVKKARYVVICHRDDSQSIHIALLAKKLNPNARIIVLAHSSKTAEILEAAGVQYIVPATIVARVLASMVFEPNVAVLVSDLTTAKGVSDLIEIPADKYVGLKFKDALIKAREKEDLLLVGVVGRDGRILVNPSLDHKIESGDKLLAVKGTGKLSKIVK